MTLIYIRIFFVILSTVAGYYIGDMLKPYVPYNSELFGVAFGFGGAFAVILLEVKMRRASIRNLSAAVFGLVFGFFMGFSLAGLVILSTHGLLQRRP